MDKDTRDAMKKVSKKSEGTKAGGVAATLPGPGDKKEVSYVVGIGASAGGIEAFSEMLEHLPDNSGMAFILVQHLDPTHESMLSEIFQRKTKVPVEEARDEVAVEPDRVYVIPPNRYMELRSGKLRLVPRDARGGKFMPIDHFFDSLAADRKNMAIGVVLSGTANDGTQGLRSIKTEGGLTFAQDEQSAVYPDMPKNAVIAGVVDFVLNPQGIARELARIGRYPLIVVRGERKEEAEEELTDIFRMLRRVSGIDFSNYKLSTIRRRIDRRMMLAKVENIPDYVELLKNSRAEQENLAGDLLINVTSFFRDPEIFDLLKEKILPELLKQKKPGAPMRVWIAGCSTGEEAYSLAICLQEATGDLHARFPLQIFATDISEWAVERARAGIYPDSIANEVSMDRLRRFFTKVEGGYQVTKSIRDICIFARQDLAKDPPFSRLDLISCRNVLIYLSPALQKKIIPAFHYALNPDGVLVLGASETIGGFADLFSLMDKKHKLYLKKQAAYRVAHEFHPGTEEKRWMGKKAAAEAPEFDVLKEADRILLASFAPASILINENMDILQFRGRTGDYIEPVSGNASLNLMKMLREGLLMETRSLVAQARKQNLPLQKRDLAIQMDGREKRIDLDVLPVRPPEAKSARFFLLVFRESAPSAPQPQREEPRSAKGQRDARQLEQLRQDLQATREYLQTTLEEKDSMSEEYRAAIEEIQSSNEELQSTNEELETAKEELQSTNEELITVNEELQNRNAELSQVNNDLSNLLNNVSLPVVMLTTDLKVRRFTPMAERTLKLIPADVGRPFSDLRLNIQFPDLEGMFHDVIDSLAARELEVREKEGRWYLLRVRPYMTVEKKVDGVVLTLLDIHEMKEHMEQLRQAEHFTWAIVDTVREPLLVLDAKLRIISANRNFYSVFQVTPAETEGSFLYDLGSGQWNIPELRRLLEEILPKDNVFDNFEVEHDFPSLGRKQMVLNARKITLNEAEGGERILLAIEEKRGEQ